MTHRILYCFTLIFSMATLLVGDDIAGKTVFTCDFKGPYIRAGKNRQDKLPVGCSNNYDWGQKDISLDITDDPAQLINIKAISSGAMQYFIRGVSVWQTKYYRVSFMMKAENFSGSVSSKIRQIGSPWKTIMDGIKVTPGSEWARYSFTGRPVMDKDSDVGLLFEAALPGKIWIKDVKIEEFVSDPSPPRKMNPVVKGNLLPRSSYEGQRDYLWHAGIYGDQKGHWEDPALIRAEDSKFGKYSMGFPAAQTHGTSFCSSYYIDVAGGNEYTFSFWAKNAQNNVTLNCNIRNAADDKTIVAKRLKISSEWTHYSVTAKISKKTNKVYIFFTASAHHGTFLLDGLQFEHGSMATPYSPAYPAELYLLSKPEGGNLYYWGEKIPIEIYCARNDNQRTPLKATIKVTAFPNREIESIPVSLTPGEPLRIELNPNCNGLFNVSITADTPAMAAGNEIVVAKLPPPRPTGEESYFGTHMTVRPFFMDYAARVGFKWTRLHDAGQHLKWKVGEKTAGQYAWEDRHIDALLEAGFHILALPDDAPAWAMHKENVDVAAFEKYCAAAAAHFKGRINHWEIWNEPYMKYFFKGTAEHFAEVYNAGAAGIKAGNPDAKVIGICSELSGTRFIHSVPASVWEHTDIVSFHLYFQNITGLSDASFSKEIQALKNTIGPQCPKEFWNSEGANWEFGGSSFYSFMQTPEKINRESTAFAARVWMEAVKSGMTKVFIYTLHQTDTLSHNGKGLKQMIDFDRSITPPAVANAVCAWAIDGLKPVAIGNPIPGTTQSFFMGKEHQTWAIYSDLSSNSVPRLDLRRLPPEAEVVDVMGNRPQKDVLKIDIEPIFVVAPASCLNFLEKCQRAVIEP